MIDFEKIGDTFEDGFDKVKDFTKKNKVFTIAICGVGAFALYKLFTSKSSQDTEYTATYAYVPTGYDGYPEMSESISYDDLVDQMRTETSDINESFYNEILSDVSQIIEDAQNENEKRYENIVQSSKPYSGSIITGSYIEEQRERQEIINQMKNNSEAWHTASESERKRLEAENQELGSIIGATFNSASGVWSDNGQTLYEVSVKNKTNSSTANLTNVGVTESPVSRTDVIAQMKSNSEAWLTASDSEKKRLEAENQVLGKSIGATYNSASGVWSDNGQTLYNVTVKNTSSSSKSNKTSSKSNTTANIVSQMQSNSKAWLNASDSERKALAEKNQALGKQIGATYNSASGTWSKDGKQLY